MLQEVSLDSQSVYQVNGVIRSADSYKLSHKKQIYPGTTLIYETMTPRSLKHLAPEIRALTNNKVVWFGAYMTMRSIHEAFQREFFSQPIEVAMEYFKAQAAYFTGGEYDDSHIVELHNLGYLPIKVKSIKEGSLVNVRVPTLTLRNTHKDFAWLTGFLETVISNETWKSATNATIAFAYRVLLEDKALETVGDASLVKWQGHDFSARGMSGSADAAKQGCSHLTSFMGTDGFGSIGVITSMYNMDKTSFVGGSIPASEHMTETLSIQVLAQLNGVSLAEAEYMQMKRLITELYPSGMIARVCDSYDYWNVVTNIVPRLKEEILSRKPDALGMAKVVIRPDSGDPVDIVCGLAIPVSNFSDVERWFDRNPKIVSQYFVQTILEKGEHVAYYMLCEINEKGLQTKMLGEKEVTPELKGTVSCLWETFGGTLSDKGYRILDSHIGMIYGDSITVKRAKEITERLEKKGFASINCFLGIGSYTYQMNSRDTLGQALKATFAVVDDIEIDLVKDPKTDDGTKKSAKGRVRVEFVDGDFVVYDQQTETEEEQGLLEVIYEDGKLYGQSFDSVRALIDENVQFLINKD